MNNKNNFSLLNFIDFITEKSLIYVKKAGKMISSKTKHDTVYIFSKIIITIIVLALLKIPFDLLKEIGVLLIYNIGSSFRNILSICLKSILDISYLILTLIVFLKVFESIWKNKEINFSENNRKKDRKIKDNVFEPLVKFVKIFLDLCLIPLVIIIVFLFLIIAINIYYLINGYSLISLFFICFGLILMILSVVLIVTKIIKGGSLDE